MPQIFDRIKQEYQELEFSPNVTQSRENLCTVCKQVVPRKVFECANRHQTYWKPNEIAFRSLMFPSWGDWIMGHRMLASVELFGYLFSWIIMLAFAFSPGESLLVLIAIMLVVLFFEHVVDAFITLAIAQKGLTPKKPLVSRPVVVEPI